MKNIFAMLALVIAFVACEPDRYDKPDISEVEVYQINGTNTQGKKVKINIYKTVDLVVKSQGNDIVAADVSNREDLSDAVSYDISFDAEEVLTETVVIMAPIYGDDGNKILDGDGNPVLVEAPIEVEATYNYQYDVTGDVENGTVSATIEINVTREYLGDNKDYEYSVEENSTETVTGSLISTRILN